MNSEVKLAVNTCNNSQYNYTYYQDATRTNYSDVDDYVPYVTSNFPYIKKGETANNVTNRVLSYDLDSEDPMYVRVIPEFTNERKARSDKEMLKFNGRYVVYQVELKALAKVTLKQVHRLMTIPKKLKVQLKNFPTYIVLKN